MNRMVRRSFQWSLVIALTVLLGGSPASAGWLRHKLQQHSCKPASSCCVVAKPACPPPASSCCPAPTASCAPASCAPMAASSVPSCDYSAVPSCCDGSSVSTAPMEFAPAQMSHSHDMGMPIEMGSPIEMPMEGTIVDDTMMAAPMNQSFDQGSIIEPANAAPMETTQQPEQPFETTPSITPPVPTETETEPAEPAPQSQPDPPADSRDDDLFGGSPDNSSPIEMPAEEPAEAPAEEPAIEMPADDLFGGGDTTEPTLPSDPVDDDLFGGPSTDAPAEAESSTDDLFGTPPADSPAEEPSDAMDDLFGDPSADEKGTVPESEDQPSIDDLFGDAGSQNDSTDESMVSEASSVDELFGSSESAEAVSEAASNEPSNEADADFDIDDLFGKKQTPLDQAVAVVEALPAPIVNTVEDSTEVAVQVVSKKAMPTDGLAETRSRTWIDNTGLFHVEGRLIEVTADHVRLLKTNGKTCTVPSSRLCEADAAYVDAIREQVDSSRLAMLISK